MFCISLNDTSSIYFYELRNDILQNKYDIMHILEERGKMEKKEEEWKKEEGRLRDWVRRLREEKEEAAMRHRKEKEKWRREESSLRERKEPGEGERRWNGAD